MPGSKNGPTITGASKTSIDAALEDQSRLVQFPDCIVRIMTLQTGTWEALERFHRAQGLPMRRFADAVYDHATTTKSVMPNFEDRLRKSFRDYARILISRSIDPPNRPANW